MNIKSLIETDFKGLPTRSVWCVLKILSSFIFTSVYLRENLTRFDYQWRTPQKEIAYFNYLLGGCQLIHINLIHWRINLSIILFDCKICRKLVYLTYFQILLNWDVIDDQTLFYSLRIAPWKRYRAIEDKFITILDLNQGKADVKEDGFCQVHRFCSWISVFYYSM